MFQFMFVKGNNILPKNILNILLIQLGDIGDVILSFPCIRALRENFPLANIIVAVKENASELIEDCPWATGVVSINKDKRRWAQEIAYQRGFFSRLRKFHFDVAIDLRTGTRGAILAFLSGARQRIGFYAPDGKLWRNMAFSHLAFLEAKAGMHLAECYLKLLTTYNVKTANVWPKLDIPLEKQQRAVALIRRESIPLDQPLIAVQPFSLWRHKDWGPDKYIRLINWISLEYKFPVIITGSPDQREQAEEIAKMCRENVYNFTGKTSTGIFAAILKACGLFIGGDSAGMHIAAAVGTPTVSIFGPSSSVGWAPRGKLHYVVQKNLPCIPCHKKGCQDSGISRCLEELTVNEVISVVKTQIEKISTP